MQGVTSSEGGRASLGPSWSLSTQMGSVVWSLISSELFFLLGCSKYFNSAEWIHIEYSHVPPNKVGKDFFYGGGLQLLCLGPVVCLPETHDQWLHGFKSFFHQQNQRISDLGRLFIRRDVEMKETRCLGFPPGRGPEGTVSFLSKLQLYQWGLNLWTLCLSVRPRTEGKHSLAQREIKGQVIITREGPRVLGKGVTRAPQAGVTDMKLSIWRLWKMPWGVTPLLWLIKQFTHQLEGTSANGQVPETLRRVGLT